MALKELLEDWNLIVQQYVEAPDVPSLLLADSKELQKCIVIPGAGNNEIDRLEVSIVLPWVMVYVYCPPDITLKQLKIELLRQLRPMAIEQCAIVPGSYIYRILRSGTGEMEPIYNEDMKLNMVEMSTPYPMLFLHEPEGLKSDQEFCENIGLALGYDLRALEAQMTSELRTYRANLWHVTADAVENRGSTGYTHYAFPEERTTEVNVNLYESLNTTATTAKIQYVIYYVPREQEEMNDFEDCQSVKITFDVKLLLGQLIDNAMELLKVTEGGNEGDEFLLQLPGQKRYLTRRDLPVVAYATVRSDLLNCRLPQFVLRRKDIVLRYYPIPRSIKKPAYVHAEEGREALLTEKKPTVWNIDENLFIKPVTYSSYIARHDDNTTLVMTFSFYVGTVLITKLASSEISPKTPRWRSDAATCTGLYVKDIAESLMICVELFEVKRNRIKKSLSRERKEEDISSVHSSASAKNLLAYEQSEREKEVKHVREPVKPLLGERGNIDFLRLREECESRGSKDNTTVTQIGWVNMSMFDWRGELQVGVTSLCLRPGETQYPGPLGSNDKTDEEGKPNPKITIDITTGINSREWSNKKPCTTVDDIRWLDFFDHTLDVEKGEVPQATDETVKTVYDLLNRRLLGGALTWDEHKYIWDNREVIGAWIPDALVLVVETPHMWETREHFGQIYNMVLSREKLEKSRVLTDEEVILYGKRRKIWGRLSIAAAITILSCKFCDRIIRTFAVQQLDRALDNQNFPLYILPLIQALKCEVWAKSELACLILRRALLDYRIGHKVFWLLRAETLLIRDSIGPENYVFQRLSLIIEAYLRGNHDHVGTVVRQVAMVEHLSNLERMLKSKEKESASKRLREEIREKRSEIENIESPLDPATLLGELIIDKCKVIGSAKMPLRLRWKNVNAFSHLATPYHEILFKRGDDLRQDMLVLQVLEVMDNEWKSNQMDCSLSIYNVLPTGFQVGMIEVVPNCATIFEIQSGGGKVGTAVKSLETTFMNEYLRSMNPHNFHYMKCTDRFTMSCVGYSVATFIMGIKDRHSDNIMMTNDGKLFHIDFGHILGHGKTKLGIQRDRVPFVLTEHFLCVITRGKAVKKNMHDVESFRKMCNEAYLILWEQRMLWLSLFTAMQSMELPELSSTADLNYLKKTLCVNISDREEASLFFNGVWDKAFEGSWSTKTNWFFHAVKHM